MRSFFYYTQQERRGIILLSILCFILFAGQWLLPLFDKPDQYNFSAFQEKIAQAGMAANEPIAEEEGATSFELFYFNPNTISEAELQKLGLSTSTIRAWLSYLRKGGRFYSIKDIQGFRKLSEKERTRILPYLQFANTNTTSSPKDQTKPVSVELVELYPFNPNNISQQDLAAFGIPQGTIRAWMSYRSKGGYFKNADALAGFRALSSEDFERISPFLHFEVVTKESEPRPQAFEATPPPPSNIVIDINQASAEEWQQIRGIGPGYSSRIIKFRDALGGFIAVEQLADTYGLPDSVFQAIRPQLQLSPILRKLAINQLDEASLAEHPYLNWKTASILVAYRTQHGPYSGPSALQAVRLPDPKVLDLVLPYLDFH